MISSSYWLTAIKILLFSGLVALPMFGYLELLPIRLFDESRLAMNAYEMYHNHNYLVTYYDGKPDMWNTKPPLLIWLQVLCLHVFGVRELALRLPLAVAAAVTAALLLMFSIRYLKNYWFGGIGVLFLVTAEGYMNVHVARTGDYDALLTLFILGFSLSYFTFLETKKTKYLHWFFVLIALGIFTKSVQGLMILPALFLFTIIQRKLIWVVTQKILYLDILCFVAAIASFYLLREHYNPGYLQAVWENDLGGRFSGTLENHQHEFSWYFMGLIQYRFLQWWLVPIGLLLGATHRDPKIKRVTLYAALISGTYLCLISAAKTKLEWYDAPLYPFLSILAAAAIHWVFMALRNIKLTFLSPTQKKILAFVFLIAVFYSPYSCTVRRISHPADPDSEEPLMSVSYYLKDALEQSKPLPKTVICYDGYNAHLQFYIAKIKDRGEQIVTKDWQKLSAGDVVIAAQTDIKTYITAHYKVAAQAYPHQVSVYRIE